jgi:hypothetical protein
MTNFDSELFLFSLFCFSVFLTGSGLLGLLIGLACVPVLVLTGWRFSKVHRHTDDLVYFWIDTVGANYAAAQLTTFNKWRE